MQIEVIQPTPQKKKRIRVCAYARVSTATEEQEDSLENQISYYQEYIQSNPEWEYSGVYADLGISGFKENRPNFQCMIADARAGKVDLIIVKSVSRFARNTETVLKYSRELKSIGVGIFFQLQNINTLTATGELTLTILAAFAQAESEGASDNRKLTIRRNFQAGKPAWGVEKTYGYTTNAAGEIVVCEEQAAVVRKMYELAERGVSLGKICRWLNTAGIKRPNGIGEWDTKAVYRVLHNISYKGDVLMQKTYLDRSRKRHKNEGQVAQWYVPGNHPSIVSDEQWERVQETLSESSNPTPSDTHNTYLLSGKLFCPYCGEKLLHTRNCHNGKEYWACRTNLKKGAAACEGIWLPGTIAAGWGDITEPTTVIAYEDEYGIKHFTGYPKAEYDIRKDCF